MPGVKVPVTWAVYAHTTSRRDPSKSWRIEVNDAGAFRCNCPGFIFSKAPKTCRHTAWAERDRHDVLTTTSTPPEPKLGRAKALVRELLDAARMSATAIQVDLMAMQLARSLETLQTVHAGVKSSTGPAPSTRLISFDD